MEDISQLKEELEQKITTWQREVDLKLMSSVWVAHVRNPEEDKLSDECICEPPPACLCCNRPPDLVERDMCNGQQGQLGQGCGGPTAIARCASRIAHRANASAESEQRNKERSSVLRYFVVIYLLLILCLAFFWLL